MVTFFRQIKRTGQPCGASADNGNFLCKFPFERRNHFLRYISGLCLQILFRNETFHLVNGNRLVNRASRTGVLTSAVADMPADCRERIFFLNQCQGVLISALCRHLQITLYRNVRRTCRLAGSRPCIITIDAVLIPVILRPHMGSPFHLRGKGVLGISNLAAIFPAQFLPKLYRACRTVFHAASACHAVFCLHMCHISGTGHIRRIKQLGRPQRIADIDVAVTDGKNLILAVNIRNLVDKTVLFRHLHNFQRFLSGYVATAFVGLHHIIRHIAYGNAPSFRIVPAAFLKRLAGTAARTGARCILPIVFIQPVGNMLHGDRLILHLDSLLHRNYMHTDSSASRRHHRGHFFQWQAAHTLKETPHFRMLLQKVGIHIGKLRASRNKHRQYILLFMLRILPVIFYQSVYGHLLQNILQVRFIPACKPYHVLQCARLALAHLHGNLCHLICTDGAKSYVFRRIPGNLLQTQHDGNSVCYHFRQLCNRLPKWFLGVGIGK